MLELRTRGLAALVVAAGLLASAGCLQSLKIPGIPDPAAAEAEAQKAREQRRLYQSEKDPRAIRWLLGHRLKQGMQRGLVNRILGEDGERRYNDAALKERNDGSRLSDETYQWGPDAEGNSYVLFFRNDRLVNFNPKDYR